MSSVPRSLQWVGFGLHALRVCAVLIGLYATAVVATGVPTSYPLRNTNLKLRSLKAMLTPGDYALRLRAATTGEPAAVSLAALSGTIEVSGPPLERLRGPYRRSLIPTVILATACVVWLMTLALR